MHVSSTDNLSYIHTFTQSIMPSTANDEPPKESISPKTQLISISNDTVTISKESIDALNSDMEALRRGTELPVEYHELLPVELITPLEMLVERPEENPNTSLQSKNTSTQASSAATEETPTSATPAKAAATTTTLLSGLRAYIITTMNIWRTRCL